MQNGKMLIIHRAPTVPPYHIPESVFLQKSLRPLAIDNDFPELDMWKEGWLNA